MSYEDKQLLCLMSTIMFSTNPHMMMNRCVENSLEIFEMVMKMADEQEKKRFEDWKKSI